MRRYQRRKHSGEKMPEEKETKQTLAVAVGLSKVPMLPQKLLKEALPGVRRVLFKLKRNSVRKMPVLKKVSR
jgi:hypothetical protein